jgi:dipeptidyl-peptidase-3
VQVGIHELLGHGSGKLYHQDTSDAQQLVVSEEAHPLTGRPITGPFYAPGATWDSTFGKIASPYEECRAECAEPPALARLPAAARLPASNAAMHARSAAL